MRKINMFAVALGPAISGIRSYGPLPPTSASPRQHWPESIRYR